MPVGPLEYLVIGAPGNQFMSEILPELNAIQENGLIRVVDLVFVRKNAGGTISALEVHDLTDAEVSNLGSIRDSLMGVITPEDIVTLSNAIPMDTPAVIVLLEHSWIDRLQAAVDRANAQVFIGGMVPRGSLEQLEQELAAARQQAQQQ
ncbi:MAG TPA: DUF6325 family protein [Ktedonobacteraceae bacterium]|jgi:hypothetical protein|nr:DUF6325 family protein [Ktedonobacteraceae bacterium]